MTIFNPGTSSLKSTSLESALLEAVVLLQVAEKAAQVIDPEVPNSVAVDFFTGDDTAAVTLNLPITQSIGAGGNVQFAGVPYFVEPAFSNTGSDLQAVSWAGAIVELVALLEAAELIGLAATPPTENRIQSNLSADTARMTLSAVLPISMAINASGKAEFSAVPYLGT